MELKREGEPVLIKCLQVLTVTGTVMSSLKSLISFNPHSSSERLVLLSPLARHRNGFREV